MLYFLIGLAVGVVFLEDFVTGLTLGLLAYLLLED